MDPEKDEEAFNKWAVKLIETSQDPNPISPPYHEKYVDFDHSLNGLIESRIDQIKKLIDFDYPRVESARAVGVWNSKINQVEIIALCDSSIQSEVYVKGKPIPIFDALFLLETDKLEIFENDVPWTINKAYQLFLRTSEDIGNYKNFRKVALEKYFLSSHLSDSFNEAHKEFKKSRRNEFRYGQYKYVMLLFQDENHKVVDGLDDVFDNLKSAGPRTATVRDEKWKTLTNYGFTDKYWSGLINAPCYAKLDAVGIMFQPIETLSPNFEGGSSQDV